MSRLCGRGLDGWKEGGENDQGNENGNKSDAGLCAVWRRFRLAHRTQCTLPCQLLYLMLAYTFPLHPYDLPPSSSSSSSTFPSLTPYLSFQLYDSTASFTGVAWAFIFVALLQALGDIKKMLKGSEKERKVCCFIFVFIFLSTEKETDIISNECEEHTF